MSNTVFPPPQPAQAQTGNVEIDLPWGGDFSLQANGDLVLAIDQPGNPRATTQEVMRLLYTNPRQQDANGNYYSSGDDFFHPDWGVGIPSKVGKMFSSIAAPQQLNGLIAQIQAAATKGLRSLASIAQSPTPTVVTQPDANNPSQVDLQIVCQTQTGLIVTVPARPITGGS